jgi:endonuclease/exonuclease/phosphatase family metal-dependent hydrolase
MPMIVCGDFNIVSGRLFNLLSGWTRGFVWADYSISERKEADAVISKYSFSNCFQGVTSITTKIFGQQQFDHILLSSHFRLTKQTLHPNFGSDHLILEAEVAFAGS